MSQSKKRWIVGLGIVGVAVVSVALGRRTPTFSGDAPAYRQTGAPRARVVISEYSDFQCPKCGAVVPIVKGLLSAYPKDVRLVFHHAPLKQHKWAIPAAHAAESAGLQGKFWEYAETLFSKQTEWSPSTDPKPFFISYAKDLGLNADQFTTDMDSVFIAETIRKEKAHADAIEVPATPTFFINDRMLVGDTQLSGNGARYIEQELVR
ncbi:MAG: thioredoxin domain-containing protein [Elusimicrobia bacterium]|nr:thioredoxin domain-containing protein [Elusimicrobiota bacterium]